MKNKIWSLIFGIIAALNVVYSFLQNKTTERIFSFELDIWVYRIIWFAIASAFFYDYLKKSNKL